MTSDKMERAHAQRKGQAHMYTAFQWVFGIVIFVMGIASSSGARILDCPTSGTPGDTLYHLDASDPHLRKLSIASATECCQACTAQHDPICSTWSFTHYWGDPLLCHLSTLPAKYITTNSGSYGGGASSNRSNVTSNNYKIDTDSTRQVIEGLGFEIQADSLGEGFNPTMGNKISGVPHDLVPTERVRLYNDMLKGFRTCRLALGLYLRGLDAEKKQIVGRWPTQMSELAGLQNGSGIEGFDVEYWSPPPYWKGPNQTYICVQGGKHLRSTNSTFLEEFATAMATDAQYLLDNGLRISWWGLQNEPIQCTKYPSMVYNASAYHAIVKVVLPKIKAVVPGVRIELGSQFGCHGIAAGVATDNATLSLVDSWTYHPGGQDSTEAMKNQSCDDGKSVWVNEWEYFKDTVTATDTINLAQDVMNWFVFSDSPKWTWLHALKPTYNSEASGFGLGYWRPYDDNSTQKIPLDKGHWRYNNVTWNALAGFVRHMPWNVHRLDVVEELQLDAQRILAFKTPARGKGGPQHMATPGGLVGFIVTNMDQNKHFVANVTLVGVNISGASFVGHRYSSTMFDGNLGETKPINATMSITLPPLSIEFWVQYQNGF
eukprot:m.58133 g.58133  ORF g.58133 m.58133 type:complete len:602 (+) comp22501_c0_seq1:426-2231(+)